MGIGKAPVAAAGAASAGFADGHGDARIDGLLSGRLWTGGAISYSEPDNPLDFGLAYESDFDGDATSAQFERFERLSASQADAAARALDCKGAGGGFAVEGFTALKVSYAGKGSGAGDIRLGNSGDASTAYAYLPGGGDLGGDVWFGASGRSPRAGNYDHVTVLHELGHALGLKHAHEPGAGFGKVPAQYDALEFTVMSYRSYVGDSLQGGYVFEAWGAPQSYMMLDIAALQHLYGADFTVNSGDTVYRWTPGSGRTRVDGEVAIEPGANRVFATVWDGGGRDCYDLSAYATDLRVDLRPGKHSVFADSQLADLGGGPNGGYARGNIFNALQFEGDRRSLIEVAIGGSGDDRMIGNAKANRLVAGAGDDRLTGGADSDSLVGGTGADIFVFSAAGDSRPGAADAILGGGGTAFEKAGLAGGDVIDLRGIDADTTVSGNQAFFFGAAKTKGRLWLEERGDATVVCGNTDRDDAPEFELRILDGAVRAGDYWADDFLL